MLNKIRDEILRAEKLLTCFFLTKNKKISFGQYFLPLFVVCNPKNKLISLNKLKPLNTNIDYFIDLEKLYI